MTQQLVVQTAIETPVDQIKEGNWYQTFIIRSVQPTTPQSLNLFAKDLRLLYGAYFEVGADGLPHVWESHYAKIHLARPRSPFAFRQVLSKVFGLEVDRVEDPVPLLPPPVSTEASTKRRLSRHSRTRVVS